MNLEQLKELGTLCGSNLSHRDNETFDRSEARVFQYLLDKAITSMYEKGYIEDEQVMTLDQFNEFTKLCAAQLDNSQPEDYYATESALFTALMKEVRTSLFSKELERQQRYKEFVKLKQEFEPHMFAEDHPLTSPEDKLAYRSSFNPHQGTRA